MRFIAMNLDLRRFRAGAVGVALLGVAACSGAYPPLTFTPDEEALRLSGVIDARALSAFDVAIDTHPGTTRLIFDFVPGSMDDESNLELARRVRARGLETYVPGDGLVASGGTDLFLAGTARQLAPGACVGVHTWGDETVGIGLEFPKDDPVHQPYLDYYAEIGIDAAFYWFTLEAAGPDESHWMTAAELAEHGMTTVAATALAPADSGSTTSRCDDRFLEEFDALFEEAER